MQLSLHIIHKAGKPYKRSATPVMLDTRKRNVPCDTHNTSANTQTHTLIHDNKPDCSTDPDKKGWWLHFGFLARCSPLFEHLTVVVDGAGQAMWLAKHELVCLHNLFTKGSVVVLHTLGGEE